VLREATFFNKSQLKQVLALQSKAYQLLEWFRKARASQKFLLNFSTHPHDAEQVVQTWFFSHRDQFPKELQVQVDQYSDFANLFLSFFRISFEMTIDPVNACGCDLCCFLKYVPTVKLRKVTPAMKRRRRRILEDTFLDLNLKLGLVALNAEQLDQGLQNSVVSKKVALVAYGQSLIQRAQYGEGEPALLLIWRHFAWEEGHPTLGFQLAVADLISAEEELTQYLRHLSFLASTKRAPR